MGLAVALRMTEAEGDQAASILGGWSRVCMTTQYCSVFSRKARNCS